MNGPGLALRLREATQAMHRVAERSRFMGELLKGRVEAAGYCLLLRNLHALYAALESELEGHADTPALAPLRFPALSRAAALEADLSHLHGLDWAKLPLTQAMKDYVARIHRLGAEQPPLLAAHAYVRYMADLSGGQVVGDVLRRTLSLRPDAGAAFYDFAGDATVMKELFRSALDALPIDAATADALLTEATTAFALHVRLFEELDATPASAG